VGYVTECQHNQDGRSQIAGRELHAPESPQHFTGLPQTSGPKEHPAQTHKVERGYGANYFDPQLLTWFPFDFAAVCFPPMVY
jgi:hypothetical protein